MNTRFAQMIRGGDFVVLDTETTGLGSTAEICQIAIVDAGGEVLLDTLVKPVRPIPADATRIHGITNEMVTDAPAWADVLPQVVELLTGRAVVIYNAQFDYDMLRFSTRTAGLPEFEGRSLAKWYCAMETFAEVYGEWNEYHGNYRWQRLTTAARHYDLPVEDAHSALGDCRMTLAVCRAMAAAAERDAESELRDGE